MSMWACSACGFTNKPTNQVCGGTGPMGCKAPNPEADVGGFAPVKAKGAGKSFSPFGGGGKWQCSSCGFTNRAENQVCGGTGPVGCKAPKPSGGSDGGCQGGGGGEDAVSMLMQMQMMMAEGGAGKSFSPVSGGGKWQCSSCGFTNRAQNQVCGGTGPVGCKAPKPSGGSDGGCQGGGGGEDAMSMIMQMMMMMAEGGGGKGKGKGKGKEWPCPQCGFKNSEKNQVCGGTGPMGCKAPKPEDWLCAECGFKNRLSNEVCGGNGNMGCKTPKPQPQSVLTA